MKATNKSPTPQFESLLPKSGDLKKASFDTIPFSGMSSNIDSKYALSGRYGFDLDDTAEVSELGKSSLDSSHAVPGVRTILAEGSTAESDFHLGNRHYLVLAIWVMSNIKQ